MTKREAYKRIVGYVVSMLESHTTCDAEKGDVSDADFERLCQAETDFAAELRRRYALTQSGESDA